MKRKTGFLVLLCLFLRVAVHAQGLKVGDKVPDILIGHVEGLRLNGKVLADGQVRLSAFHGKLLIIDFWATWCAPCRKMVPVMDSLQKVFGDRVVFLPVAYESARVIAPVLTAMQKIRPFDLPEVSSDVALGQLFPHRALPHYVWIDRNGIVAAITEDNEVSGMNIRKLLGDVAAAALAVKKDSVASYNPGQPLLVGGNGGDASGLVYHSILTGFKPGLSLGLSVSRLDSLGQRFTARNVPFPWLCRMAFGENGRVFPRSRTLLLSRDSALMDTRLKGQAFEAWLASGKGWCYELSLPTSLAGSAYAFLQSDLARLFPQYAVSVETREMTCLALVKTDHTDKLKSKGGALQVEITPYRALLRNAHLSQLMMRLEQQYLQNSALPVVDATGYTGRVDLALNAQLFNVTALNGALAAYGLRFERRRQAVEVLVVRDRNAH